MLGLTANDVVNWVGRGIDIDGHQDVAFVTFSTVERYGIERAAG